MEYCSYNEAFGNPDNQLIKEYNNERNIKNKRNLLRKSVEDYQKKHKLSPPHEMVAVPHKVSDNDIYHSFFNAQGDLDKNLYPSNAAMMRFHMLDQEMNRQPQTRDIRMGTKISDLKDNELLNNKTRRHRKARVTYSDDWEEKNDSLSPYSMSIDSLDEVNFDKSYTDQSLSELDIKKLAKKPKYSHNYYINKFLQDISNDGDTLSLTSSQDDIVYEHIKKCKYCKTQINKKLRQQIINKPEPVKSIIYPKILPTTILGYDIKEIIIIILIGICLIFLLDLFVKIGKKTED